MNTNYLPARLTQLSEQEPQINDDTDWNPVIEQMIEDRLFESEFENEIFERSEGFEL